MPAMVTDMGTTEGRAPRLAPSDRRAGHRGLRGRIAGAVALLALVALSTNWWHGRGGGSDGSFSYTVNGWRDWVGPVFAVLAAALLVAAAVLWKAHTTQGILLGSAIAVAAIGVGVQAIHVGQSFSTVSAASFNAARIGTPQDVVEGRLGAPLTTDASTTLNPSGVTVGCDLYRARVASGSGGYAFCFHRGVLAVKLTWPGSL